MRLRMNPEEILGEPQVIVEEQNNLTLSLSGRLIQSGCLASVVRLNNGF